MAYNIVLTSGTNLVTVADGTTDTRTTSLTLIGKNFAGYGQFLNENFVQLLENFAGPTQPANALQGQLWWDTTNKVLQVYNSTAWKNVSSTTSGTIAPINSIIGDLWWDSANGQLKIWSGTIWVVIGPSYTAAQGQTGSVADVVSDGVTSHIIVKFYVNNEVIAILSKDAPAYNITSIPGFTTLNPGLTLASVLQNSSVPKYYGPSDNALNLNGVAAANYLRNDISGTIAGNLSVSSNQGISVGAAKDFTISTATGATNLSSTVINKDVNVIVNVAGTPVTAMTFHGAPGVNAGQITVPTPTVAQGIATKAYVDNFNLTTGVSVTTSATTTTNTTTKSVVATVSATTARSVIFKIQAVNTINATPTYQMTTVHAIHDGVNVNWVEYGAIDIGGPSAVFSVSILAGQIRLEATPSTANSTIFTVSMQAINI